MGIGLLITCVSAGGITLFANWLSLLPWRRSKSNHWTERARLLWPARISAALNPWLVSGIAAATWILLFPLEWALWPWFLGSAWAGAVLAGFPFSREIFPGLRFRNWLHQLAVGWGLRLGIWVLFGIAVFVMPEQLDWRSLFIFVGVLAIHLWVQWGLAIRVLSALRTIKPASARLQQIVDDTATRMGVVVRKVWLLEGPMALAFALPTTRELLFSRRLVELADDDEISAICAHELAHLSETRATLAGRLSGSMTLFPLLFIRPAFRSFDFAGIALVAVAISLLGVFARRLSMRMEKRADRIAVEQQLGAGAYARALERFYEVNHLPAVNPDNRRTHPPLYDRLLSAGMTPEYPRPAPPERVAWTTIVLSIALGLLMTVAALNR